MTSAAATRNRETQDRPDASARLLAWYDRHHRELPWRMPPRMLATGQRPDPYHVWLSEIMLQQTTVEAVKPYFTKFLSHWPTVAALAAADQETVMKAWAGLGYYSRARNLKKCAEIVMERFGGRFPDREDELRTLPGVGAYTAAAISAIAFGRPAAVIDGNVERVVTRLAAIDTPLPGAKADIRRALETILPTARHGDFAQAMMDLGATICTPKRPACLTCPLREDCRTLASGMDPERFPIKAPKADKPLRKGAAFVAIRPDGAVLLRKRPERGLLAGMTEVPTTDWTARQDGDISVRGSPFAADWRETGLVGHVFTHFSLELTVFRATVSDHTPPAGHWWAASSDVMGEALPTVMKKIIETAIPGISKRPAGPRR